MPTDSLRRFLWRALDPLARLLGFQLTAPTHENQYALTFRLGEEDVEQMLKDHGFIRNDVAYLKHTEDGRWSIGSWALTYENADPNPWDQAMFRRDGVDETGQQLHVTIYEGRNNQNHVEVYAHEERDWRDDPEGHLEETTFDPAPEMVRWLIDSQTYMVRDQDYYITNNQ